MRSRNRQGRRRHSRRWKEHKSKRGYHQELQGVKNGAGKISVTWKHLSWAWRIITRKRESIFMQEHWRGRRRKNLLINFWCRIISAEWLDGGQRDRVKKRNEGWCPEFCPPVPGMRSACVWGGVCLCVCVSMYTLWLLVLILGRRVVKRQGYEREKTNWTLLGIKVEVHFSDFQLDVVINTVANMIVLSTL